MTDLEEYDEEVHEYGVDNDKIVMLGQHEACLVEWQAVQDRVTDYMTIDYRALGESVLGEWNLMIEWAWK